MSIDDTANLARQWVRVGVMFNVPPAAHSPDLERLLLDTARGASRNARMFILAASWLALHGDMVDVGRLALLIRHELEPNVRPVMGLLLDITQSGSPPRFDEAIALCSAAAEPRPLFEIECTHPVLRKIVEQGASAISRKWNLWARPFELKTNAVRPVSWILAQNPAYRRDRAVSAR